MNQSDYLTFRGKCKEMCEELIKHDPSLQLVRGHYYDAIWNSDEPHWWCTKLDGSIVDPTKLQFPTKGLGIYTPFNGFVKCAECGNEIELKRARFESRYAFCNDTCLCKFVGII